MFLSELSKAHFTLTKTFVFITVPSFRFLFTSHDKFLRHFRRYSNPELISCVTDNNFTVINSGYFFFSLLPMRLMNVLTGKIANRGKEVRSSNLQWRKGKVLSDIVSLGLMLDFKAGQIFNTIGIKIPGLSNYVVCKRSV